MQPPMVAARHFEDALASARQSARFAAAWRQSGVAASKQGQTASNGGADMDDMDVEGSHALNGAAATAGESGSALETEGRAADASQAAWIKAAAARAAADVRTRMAGSAGAEMAAYVQQLEAALRSAGIPLPARTA